MALSYVTYAGDGVTRNFSVTFPYIETADVDVYVDGVLKSVTSDYTWFSATVIQFTAPETPAAAAVVKIARSTTNTARLVDFQDAGNLTEADLDLSANQMFYLVQEALDNFTDNAMSLDTDDKWNANSKVIKNVADPTNAQDAATKAYGDATWGGAAVVAAEAAQTAAEAAQTAAETAQTNAETAETNAETAETGALAAQAAAEAAYDAFDDRYLGAKAVAPTLDNDGNALLTGALYWDTVIPGMRVYTGSAWVDPDGITEAYADTLYQPLDTDLSAIAALATTKGRLIVGNGSAWTAVGVGSDGQVIRADSADAEGLAWKDEGTLLTTFTAASTATLGETTAIPAGCKRIDVIIKGVTLSAAGAIQVEIGDSSGYAASSGGTFNAIASTTAGTVAVSGGPMFIYNSGVASGACIGKITLEKQDGSDLWYATALSSLEAGTRGTYTSGYIDNASVEIDRLKVTSSAGTMNAGTAEVRVWT